MSWGTLVVLLSCTDSLIHDSFANSSFHPIHACAHSCFDGRRAGFGVCGGGCALAPVSFLSDVADVPDDEDDACVDGVNSVIQGFEGHANACTSLDALPLPFLETGLKRGRTTQRGRFPRIPCARAHMRMGMAQLSGHTRDSGVVHCSRVCGGLSLP